MSLTAERQKDLAKFPDALRALVEAELAAGNAIAAIENGFPAAPCGASIKLAKAVNEARRKSAGEVKFYARNNSSYAGEFTTAERHFFVLEPPLPPEPEPDMDAIRKAHEPKPDPLVWFAQRMTRMTASPDKPSAAVRRTKVRDSQPSPKAFVTAESVTGWTRVLHFRDKRPPHEIQFVLERELMTLFAPTMDNGRLSMQARATVVGAQYSFELRYEAALPLKNCYSLRVEISWAEQAAANHDYYRKTADGWFKLWTRDFQPAPPQKADAGSGGRYQKLCEAALKAEQHLDTIPAIQQAILAAMKRGATYATAHKEGGSNICWRNGCFSKTDYGDYPSHQKFTTDEEFMKFLRQFYDWETSKNIHPYKASDFDAWKLILRLLCPG